MRGREIIIGRVTSPHYVLCANAGFPGGVLMLWRGRVGFFQPSEFITWRGLVRAVRHRLEKAGLKLMAEPVAGRFAHEELLRVVVCRLGWKRRVAA